MIGIIGGLKAGYSVGQFIKLGDRGVEADGFNPFADTVDDFVGCAAQGRGIVAEGIRTRAAGGGQAVQVFRGDAPDALGMAPGAFDAAFRPFQIANVISALLPAVNAMDHLPLIALLVLQALLSSQIIPARVLLLNS